MDSLPTQFGTVRGSHKQSYQGNRGSSSGRSRGNGRGRGVPARGRGRGGAHSNHQQSSSFDPAQDPDLMLKPPHPGFFKQSFIENPWAELEKKMGLRPHKPAVEVEAQATSTTS